MLRVLEAMGMLVLLTRETPAEIAAERKSLRKILESSASQAIAAEKRMAGYSSHLESRLAQLPKELETGLARLELQSCWARACDSVSISPVYWIRPERLTSLALK